MHIRTCLYNPKSAAGFHSLDLGCTVDSNIIQAINSYSYIGFLHSGVVLTWGIYKFFLAELFISHKQIKTLVPFVNILLMGVIHKCEAI